MLKKSALNDTALATNVASALEGLVSALAAYAEFSVAAVNDGSLTKPYDVDTLVNPIWNLVRFRLASSYMSTLSLVPSGSLNPNGIRNQRFTVNDAQLILEHSATIPGGSMPAAV